MERLRILLVGAMGRLGAAVGEALTGRGHEVVTVGRTAGDVQADVLSTDAAVLTMTYAIPHRTPADRPHTIGGAWTALFVRRAGRWVIVQEHLSDAPSRVGGT